MPKAAAASSHAAVASIDVRVAGESFGFVAAVVSFGWRTVLAAVVVVAEPVVVAGLVEPVAAWDYLTLVVAVLAVASEAAFAPVALGPAVAFDPALDPAVVESEPVAATSADSTEPAAIAAVDAEPAAD